MKTVDEWRKEDSAEQVHENQQSKRSKSPNTGIGDGLTPIHGMSINTNSNMLSPSGYYQFKSENLKLRNTQLASVAEGDGQDHQVIGYTEYFSLGNDDFG